MKRRRGHVLRCSCPSYELYLLLMQWKGFKTNAKLDGAVPCLLFTCYFNSGDSGSCRVGLVLKNDGEFTWLWYWGFSALLTCVVVLMIYSFK